MSSQNSSQDEEYDFTKLFSMKGQVTVITGASGGLGSAIAVALCRCGSAVVLIARNPQKLQAAKERVEEAGGRATIHSVDVLNATELAKAVESTYQEYGRIDALVTAQGVNRRIPTLEYPIETWDDVVNTNLKGTFLACKTVGKYMVQQKSGKIVNISSSASGAGYAWGYSAYSASKGGVNALTRTLAVEWGKFGITVNSIAPYFIHTELTKKFLSDPDTHAQIVRDIPLERIGRIRDVVGAVVFFASSASDWISGQVLYVDGGFTAH